MKKIKPLYIYLAGIVLAVGVMIIVSHNNPQLTNQTASQSMPPPIDIEGKKMPNDKIHQALENPLAQKILAGDFGPGDTIFVDARDIGFEFSKKKPKHVKAANE